MFRNKQAKLGCLHERRTRVELRPLSWKGTDRDFVLDAEGTWPASTFFIMLDVLLVICLTPLMESAKASE